MSNYSQTVKLPLPRSVWRFVWHFNKIYINLFIIIFLLQVTGAVCSTFIPYVVGKIVGVVTASARSVPFDWQPLILLILLLIVEFLAHRLLTVSMMVIRPLQRQRIVSALFTYLQGHSQRYFAENLSGRLSQAINDTESGCQQINAILIAEFLPVVIILFTSLGLLFWISPWLGYGLLLWSLLFVGLSCWMSLKAQSLEKEHAEQRNQSTGVLVDSISNMASVRFFARQVYERIYLNSHLRREKRKAYRALFYMERIRWMQDSLSLILQVGMMTTSLIFWLQGLSGSQIFVTSTGIGMLIVGNSRFLSYLLLEMYSALGCVQNGLTTILSPHEITDRKEARDLLIKRGEIEFRNLTFGYSPGDPIFRNLNLKIAAGQRVGIVGYSGSGKSTLLNLLLRLYEPQEGAILIDGIDIRDLTQKSLRRQIGLIPQEPVLFHRTLRENIAYGAPRYDQSAIEGATNQAQAHDFIMNTTGGYDALVGERGVRLSGGQRQRIAIARVLLKNARILILDEATSSLDSDTEKMIQSNLDEIMGDRTVLVIAHRLSTIAHLDRILVFSEGNLVEDGNHETLMKNGGIYCHFWSQQVNDHWGKNPS